MRAIVHAELVASKMRDGRTDVSSIESDGNAFRQHVSECVTAHDGVSVADRSISRSVVDARTFAQTASFATMGSALRAAVDMAERYREPLPLEPGEWRAPGLRIAIDLDEPEGAGTPWQDPLHSVRGLCAAAPAGDILVSYRAVGAMRRALPPGARLESAGTFRLRDLMPQSAIYRIARGTRGAESATLHTLDAIPNNLPTFGDRFVGRASERRELGLLLKAHRLVSIVGASGLGKTRLALHTAAEIAPEYPAGVWLVELADLDDPDLLPEAIAVAMGLKPTGRADRLQSVIGAIRRKRALVLIENCEHMLDASARIIQRLLRECPNMRILATSIQALGVDGEHRYELEALALPAEGALQKDRLPETLVLLAVRAEERGAPLQLDPATLDVAADLCRLLEGNPLAIELAAARVTELDLSELLTRVRERFEALGEIAEASHPRMRSLHAAIDWSTQLLSQPGQQLFRRFSVFRGGATLDAVRAVTAGAELPAESIPETVGELVAKHFMTEQPSDTGVRISVLTSLRAHAAGLLESAGGATEVRRRHAEHYAREVADVSPLLNGPEQLPALRYLRSEIGNIRAALEFLHETRDVEAGLRMAASLRRFWATSGLFEEGRRMITRLLATEGADSAPEGALAAALFSLGSLETRLSDFDAAEAHIRDALSRAERAGHAPVSAKAHNALGRIAWRRGRVEIARAQYEAALALFEELDHPVGIATAQNNLALTDLWFGLYTQARERLERSLEIALEVGNQRGIAETLNNLAGVVEIQSDYTLSRALVAECLAVLQRVEDRRRTPMAINNLAHIALRRGRIQDARDLCEEALRRQREIGDASGIALSSIERGLIALDVGDTDSAAIDFETAWAMGSESGESRLTMAARHGLGEIARRRGDFDVAKLALEEALSGARSMPDHLETARLLYSLGRLELDRGHREAAVPLLAESLSLRHRIGNRRGIAETLEALARAADDPELAARMLGAAGAGRAEIGAPLPPADGADWERAVEGLRERLGSAAFEAAFAAGEALSLDECADEIVASVAPEYLPAAATG